MRKVREPGSDQGKTNWQDSEVEGRGEVTWVWDRVPKRHGTWWSPEIAQKKNNERNPWKLDKNNRFPLLGSLVYFSEL